MTSTKCTLMAVLIQVMLLFCAAYAQTSTQTDLVVPAKNLPLPLNDAQYLWLDEHTSIQIGAMNDWPPLNFINLNGKADGFGLALLDLMNQRLGGRLHLINGDWPVLYQQVVDQQLDALLDLTPTPEHEPFFNFTKPYLDIPHVIIGRDEPPYYLHESELIGKTIALEEGFGNVNFYSQNYPQITIREYPGTSEALGAVVRGEAEAYIGNRAVANYIIRNELIDSLKVHSRANQDGTLLAIGVRKDLPQLAEILQIALQSISDQEFYALLNDVIEQQTAIDRGNALQLTPEEQQWLDDHPVIRLASDPHWPPLEFIDQYDRYTGIAADFIALVEQKLGVQFIPSPKKNWTELVNDVKERNLDVFTLVMNTPSRQAYTVFTQPYVSNVIVIVTQNKVDFISGVDGLIGKTVAVEKSYAVYEFLTRDYPQLTIKTYPTTADGLTAVSGGKAFAFIGNIATISHTIQISGLTNLRISGETPYRYELGMGVRSDWPILATILDKALASISAQERAEIFADWVHLNPPRKIPWLWFIVVAASVLGLLGAILYWNYLLNQKVKQRTLMLEYSAMHDTLTGLPNRAALTSQLDQRMAMAERAKAKLAVLFIDLDDFKRVNDAQGHSVGDQLLLSVAQRLKQSLRRADVISRFGGDEFVVITANLNAKEDIESVCLHLQQAMEPMYQIGDLTINIGMSIGIAIYPDDGKAVDDLLRNADIAMYTSKKQGGKLFHFFSGEMNEHITRRIQLEQQMMAALDNQEFFVALQPIMRLDTGLPEKFEVLARWENARLGNISPEEFIPLAERNGFIITLGEFILEQGLIICARLRDMFDYDISITVNVSPRQLKEPDFIANVQKYLQQTQLPPEVLILEITEGVLINHDEQTKETMAKLILIGVRLAMDDFGTGYSSLSYIRNFPFEILKIDREFVQDISSDAKSYELVESVLAMAKSMGIDVVAEGVENESQENRLHALGCMKAQGYFYSRPLREADLMLWLQNRLQTTPNP